MKLKPHKTYLCINSELPIFTKGKTYSTIERKLETLIRDDNSLYWPVSYLGSDDVSFSQIEKDEQNEKPKMHSNLSKPFEHLLKERVNLTGNTNPQHYQKPIEPIKYMEDNFSDEAFTGFLEGNIIKYISRYRDKNGVEDLKKAKNYLERLIKKVDK